jgi:hypothetical protein
MPPKWEDVFFDRKFWDSVFRGMVQRGDGSEEE